MPVMLERGAFDAWLDPKIVDAMPMLRAANANGLTCYPVSRAVNAVANDDARLLERVPEFGEGAGESGPVKAEEPGKKQLGLF
jgi:putative SOS response-associated peptidase YedK